MNTPTTALWQGLPVDWADQLAACIDRADHARRDTTAVFFRADDIAVPSRRMTRLTELFNRYDCPLGLAVVPAWLTVPRWKALHRQAGRRPDLWCWHQHGWQHHNHETEGKKQEFGPSRGRDAIFNDLDRGRGRLQAIMGDAFVPIFTPPWNRCDKITLALLQEMGYKAVSRSQGSQPPPPETLPDLAVGVDLHTDRTPSAADGWQRLTDRLEKGLCRPACGIMIHHQRMNDAAFCFLERLLDTLNRHSRMHMIAMQDLLS